jgi:hypothetical protein
MGLDTRTRISTRWVPPAPPRSPPFHSVKLGAAPVFHNNDGCYDASRIDAEHWRAGDGSRTPCEQCARLNAAQRPARQCDPVEALCGRIVGDEIGSALRRPSRY